MNGWAHLHLFHIVILHILPRGLELISIDIGEDSRVHRRFGWSGSSSDHLLWSLEVEVLRDIELIVEGVFGEGG